MAFDYKKEYKEFYLPPKKPVIVTIPKMNYIAIRGKGDPNEEDGEYKRAMSLLYPIAYTLKMSPRSGKETEGYFEYVVPPLEGLWWQEGIDGFDLKRKNLFNWISLIRLPEFFNESDVDWAKEEVKRKKDLDTSSLEFFTYKEGLCVKMMHIGSFDNEGESVKLMNEFIKKEGFENDFSPLRLHHEIYLSDFRRTAESKLKTVIRHPIKKR
ncbi:MAG: GyrI-like domain-containing protein [Candidatus Ornithospirochaeta sp.]